MEERFSTNGGAKAGRGFPSERVGRLTGLTRSQIRALMREGKRFHGRVVTVFHSRGPGEERRLAIVVPAACGAAVRRNRFRRVVREYLRLAAPLGLACIVKCRRPIDPQCEAAARDDLRRFLAGPPAKPE